MTTFAPYDSALDERTRQAWTTYRDGLAELGGRVYDEAEAEAWERLQDALREIEADRAALHTDGERPG